MEFIIKLFTGQGTAPTLVYLCLAAFVGVFIGKIEIKKIRFGIAGVLFSGLFIAHMGVVPDQEVLHFIREFGLILFVYSVGLDVGPRFFSSFKNIGLKLNFLALIVVFAGYGIALCFHFFAGVPSEVITGIMCGAVTNTPGLGAAQQVLADKGAAFAHNSVLAGMGYAVAYPFGVFGIILAMVVIRIVFRIKIKDEADKYTEGLKNSTNKLESVKIAVTNPNLFGKQISYIKTIIDKELVISRIFRNSEFMVAVEGVKLQENDVIFGVSTIEHLENLEIKIGKVEIIQKKEIGGELAMVQALVTNRKYAGKTIQQIGIYRRYEANITRIYRAGFEILPTLDTTVEFGDSVRIVGKKDLLAEIKSELGDSVKELSVPNSIPIFLGIFLGIILGSVPIYFPGMPAPAKLGLAGGPLIVSILLGYKGRIGSLDFYMTYGANMMLREIGIVLFLASVGLLSGAKFVETIYNGGYWWMLYGAAITFVPVIIAAIIGRMMKLNYLKICGFLAGSMTDPPALEYANSLAPVQAQSTAYATVYPLTMFLRVMLAQLFILTTF
jgi:putative transport protein